MIYVTHGSDANCKPNLFIYRNILDEGRFADWLLARPRPLVSLTAALAGQGDALTIDDGTVAAARAARLAASLGHRVTLFVNPYHAISDEQYFFALINPALDNCKLEVVEWRGQMHDLRAGRDIKRFRGAIKKEWRTLNSDILRNDLVRECLRRMDQAAVEPAPHLQTLRLHDLMELQDSGVTVENHGWTHGDFASLTVAAVLEEVKRAADWIELNLKSALCCPFWRHLAASRRATDLENLVSLDEYCAHRMGIRSGIQSSRIVGLNNSAYFHFFPICLSAI
jgi:peptidoglycan/xylan/chitin deacetylase (PgdA/CDA1 family)